MKGDKKMKPSIYLAGKINYNSYGNWKFEISEKLNDNFKINTCKLEYNKEIKLMLNREYTLLDKSDILLINFDFEESDTNSLLHLGSIMSRAFYQHKPIIVFSSKDWVKNNEIVKYYASIICNSLDTSIDYINMFL